MSRANHTEWRELYRRVLLEPEPMRAGAQFQEACRAIRKRALEIWYAGACDTRERQELDAALYFLNLLKKVGAIDKEVSQVGKALELANSRTPPGSTDVLDHVLLFRAGLAPGDPGLA